MKKIVRGNDFTLRVPVMKIVNGERVAFPLPGCTDIKVNIVNQYRRVALGYTIDVSEDNVLLARVEGDKVSIGTYALEVKGKLFGNDWRSNEYEQFQIVDNNAAGDTAFEPQEGEDSVEMDTATVILAPSVELTQLIDKANLAVKTSEATNTTLNANEDARKEAETQRVNAESERVNAERERFLNELGREEAERTRTRAESDRVIAERTRVEDEYIRHENEIIRKNNETERVAAEQERVKVEKARVSAEGSRANAETERASAETQRASTEDERVKAETGRASAEAERVKAEKKRQTDTDTAIQNLNTHRTEFDDAEAARVKAENGRVEAEKTRQQAETDRASAESERVDAEGNRVSAETKRKSDFDAAIKASETATANAEKVNATITEENVFEVTDRTGTKKTLDMSGVVSVQSDVARIQESIGVYSDRPDITLVAKETNKAISADGVKVTKAGWAIAEFTAELGNIYLFNPGETSRDVCVFAEYIDKVETRAIDYAYTYDESGRVLTAKATYNGKTYTYTYDYSGTQTVITDQSGNTVNSLPSVYTTMVGAYNPMTILNADAELPVDGYCRFVSNFTTASSIKIAVSYKVGSADLTMKVERDGSTANMCTQLAKINKKVDNVSARIPDMWVDIYATKRVAVTIDNKLIWLNPRVNYRFENVESIKFGANGSASLSYVKKVAFHYNKIVKMITFSSYEGFTDDTGTIVRSSLKFIRELDVSGWDTSNFNFRRTFYECNSIKKLDVASWNTSNATELNAIFTNCSSLTELDVSAWDTSNVTNMNKLFLGLTNLQNLKFGENFGKMKDECGPLDLSSLSSWKNDSVKSLLTLYDRKANGMGVITIKLHANAKAVLGEDGIAQLTAKGYIIV